MICILTNFAIYCHVGVLLQTVMKYIIHQDKPESLQDALRVVTAYSHMSPADAYMFQIKFLIKKNRVCTM